MRKEKEWEELGVDLGGEEEAKEIVEKEEKWKGEGQDMLYNLIPQRKELVKKDEEKRELKNEIFKLVKTAGSLELSEKQRDILFAPVREEDVEIRPDGLIYLPWMEYASRLTRAFATSWCILPLTDPKLENELIIREYCLVIKGVLMGTAYGEQKYYASNPVMSWGDAIEGAKSNALMRLCKGIGISLELWKPAWIRQWKSKYAKMEWRKNKKTGKMEEYWYKKNEGEKVPEMTKQERQERQEREERLAGMGKADREILAGIRKTDEERKDKDKGYTPPLEQSPEKEEKGNQDKRKITPAQIKRLYAMMKGAGLTSKEHLCKYISSKILRPAGDTPITHFHDIERWAYRVICEELQQRIDLKQKEKKEEIIEVESEYEGEE